MLKVFNDFTRDPTLLAEFDAVARCYSASCVFADVQYRTGAMHSAIKPPFVARAVGQALTVQLSKGDLVDPLKALEMGQSGDIIVVDAGGDTETSVCGGLMGGLAKNRGIRGMIVDGAGRDVDELRDIGWPIWTRAITARGTHTMFSGRKEELSINVPVQWRSHRQSGRLRGRRRDRGDGGGAGPGPRGARPRPRPGRPRADHPRMGGPGQDDRGPAARVRPDLSRRGGAGGACAGANASGK